MNPTNQNDLQQAIDAANNNNDNIELGVPPMPPAANPDSDAPFENAFTGPSEMPPVAGVDVIPPSEVGSHEANDASQPNDTPAEGDSHPTDAPASEPSAETILSDTIVTPENLEKGDLTATREGILRDLMPLMDKVESDPERKFDIYKEAMSTLHDKNLVSGAYKEAVKISDETKKADALMTLLNAIDTL